MSRRSRKPAATREQRRQRELAWLLYITEGLSANAEHARIVNCATLNDADHLVLVNLLEDLARTRRALRKRMLTPL